MLGSALAFSLSHKMHKNAELIGQFTEQYERGVEQDEGGTTHIEQDKAYRCQESEYGDAAWIESGGMQMGKPDLLRVSAGEGAIGVQAFPPTMLIIVVEEVPQALPSMVMANDNSRLVEGAIASLLHAGA